MSVMKEMKNPIPKLSGINRQGFVCTYFLVMFLMISTLSTLLLTNQENRLKTQMNCKKIDAYLAQEAVVMSYMKCALLNHRVENTFVSTASVDFEIKGEENYRTIVISSPCFEILQIECNESDGTLYDYEVVRNETLPY